MKNYLKGVNRGVIFLIISSFASSFAFSFIPLFLFGKGVPLYTIIFLVAAYSIISVGVLAIIKTYYVKKYMLFGLFLSGLLIFSLTLPTEFSIYFFTLFAGLVNLFFWVVLNYLYFIYSSKETNATSSTWYIVIPGIIGLVMPAAAVLVIKSFNFEMVYWIAFIMFIISIIFTRDLLKEKKIVAKTLEGLKKFKGLKSISLIEGSLHFLNIWIIPVISLMYLKKASDFGFFFSYLALISLIVSFFIAKHSDKSQKRKKYVYILFSLLLISTLSLAFVKTPVLWVIAVGIFASLYTVSFPLRLAISMDLRKIDMKFWKTREIFLNFGKAITLSITGVFIFYNLIWAVFLMFSILMIIYMFLIEYKLKGLN